MTIKEIINKNQKEIDLKKSDIKPLFVFLGGIPGSGKTLLTEKVKRKYNDRDFIVIEADLYRKYLDINYEDRYCAVEKSIEDSNYIEENLLNYAIKKRKNIISISSLRAKNIIYDLIENKLIENDYMINFEIMINNKIDSILSSLERYVDHIKSEDDVPRFVKMDYFKLCCVGLKDTIKSLENCSYINEVSMFKRGSDFGLPIEIFNTKTKLGIKKKFNKEEEFQIHNLDNKTILKRLDNVLNYLKNNSPSEKEKEELKKIKIYIESNI